MQSQNLSFHALKAISPIDGRHRIMTAPLAEYFSEYALIKYRLFVEIEYLITLCDFDAFTSARKLSEEEKRQLRTVFENFTLEDAQIVNNIDRFGYNGSKPTNHDVKAVEYFLRMKMDSMSVSDLKEMVHFGLTSADINNNAYNCMLNASVTKVYLPALHKLIDTLVILAVEHKETVMVAKTHGQDAVPTTFGKEVANFVARLMKQYRKLKKIRLTGKVTGAVGNYNAHYAAANIDWVSFSKTFVRSLGFEPNIYTTQIEPHDSLCELFSIFTSLNNIICDFTVDMWLYISRDYVVQKAKAHEVGSSTMPQKVNPWRFEVAEGSCAQANAHFAGYIARLQQSRMQRDLSDHEPLRAMGEGIACSLIAVLHALQELERITVNHIKMEEDLVANPSVITEGIQTILRANGHAMPYEKLKALSRGKKMTMDDLHAFISSLEVSQDIKTKLLALSCKNYIGVAVHLVDSVAAEWKNDNNNTL